MYKILIPLVMLLLPMWAKADYSAITFKVTDGQDVTASLTDLAISFTETELVAESASGTYRILLSDLVAMEYTNDTPTEPGQIDPVDPDEPDEPDPDPVDPDEPDDPDPDPVDPDEPDDPDPVVPDDPDTGVAEISAEGDVIVYAIGGYCIGNYESLQEAIRQLAPGLYIINNQTVIIR